MATVDSLDIQISAQVNKANASLSTLVNRLDKVSASLSGVNTRGLATLGAGVNKLSNAMSNFSNNTKTADFSRLTRNLNALSNIDAGAISSASSSLAKIANGMKAFENIKVSDSAKQLAEFANGVKQLGYSSASKAIENIPKLAAATKSLMAELSKAPKVSQNIIDMTNALARLARTGSSSGKAADALSRSFASLSKTSVGSTKNLAKMPSIFKSIWKSIIPLLGIRQLFNWGKQAIEASSDLTEVQNVVDVTFGDYKNKIEDLAKVSIPEFGMSELTAKQIAGRFQSMGIAIGFSQGKMSDMSVELTKLAADMASFYNVEQEDVAKSLQSVFTGETEPLRKYGLDLTQATLKEWALNNGLNANIQSMSQAEKTMLRYQYVLANTGAAQGDFARTADTWANQVRVLKQNFQALASVIGGTLINALKPLVKALNIAMGYIISFAKTISNALGKIFGWTYEEGGGGTGGFADDFGDAAGSAGDIADSTGTAAKNVEKIQKGLRAFDELNVINLTEETGATGGSGAGAGAGGAGGNAAGGQWKQGESILKSFESEIDNLYDLGKYIGDALTKAMDSIDWNKIYKKAENFGKGLASFLNGLISPELFGALGRTIAGSLNTALHFLNSFGTTFDWKNFGLSIASGINNFFATFDFALLAKTINAWVQGVWTTIKTSISKIKWGKVLSGIYEFFDELDFVPKAFITLKTLPKLFKAITASKFVIGFKKLENATKLVTTSFAGNLDNAVLLKTQYPKLGKAVDVARKAFANFRFGIENGNLFTGLSEGIATVRNNLTGLQKGVITAVAGFAEFTIVSDAFEGLVDGSENVVAGLAKIGAAVGAAGLAMYTALGPAGLAIAGITGLVAAIKGINDAFDAIRAEEIGNTIKNAMITPGGVPLSEIVSQFKAAFSEASSGFDLINEKSSEMTSVQKNIENTWTEIYKIQEAMENGVLSVEEGKAQLETLFSELATLTEQKFSTMNSAIISAYGEGGAFRTALDAMGADTENAIDTMITYGYENSQRAKEIAQELTGVDINSEKYKSLITELADLSGEMSSFEQATSDFTYNMNSLQGKIDYSEIFLEDGAIDTEALKTYLNQASEALGEYKTSLDTAGKEISGYWQTIYNSPAATEEQKAVAKEQLDYIPQAVEEMKSDAELQVVSFTDMLQNDFISKTNQIIDDSIAEWGEKSAVEKWWSGVWGAGTESEYVKEAVEQQQTNIEELSSAIEETLGDLETEGVVWASDAAKGIYDALFDSEYIYSEMGAGHYKYTLNENYKDIINGATEGITELAGERGKDAVDGYANGFSENEETATTAATTFIEKVMKAIAEAQDSHSPSKVTKGLGKDAVDGYSLGISENENEVLSVIKTFSENIISKFSEMISPFAKIGVDAMSGLYNGLKSMEKNLYDKAQEIADNIAKTIKTALDIHSPSRVMFELGDYTMQGFQNGLENLYQPIISSVKDFSYELQVAPFKKTESLYKNYQSVYANVPSNNRNAYIENTYNNSNYETNAILREILYAVKEGKNIEINIDRKPVFDAVMSENREAQRLNRSHMLTSY